MIKSKQSMMVVAAVVTACVLTLSHAQASGSYCVCLPKPPVHMKAGKVDRDKFDLGQKVFNGKAAPAQADANAQRARLEALQGKLPAGTAKKKQLPALAGKVSAEQLEALEYFVEQRYGATESKK